MEIFIFVFIISVFIIGWGMLGYKMSLVIIQKLVSPREIEISEKYIPTVTIMIVAHNEERIIEEKLNNVIKTNYPKDKIEYLVASDNSSDTTNQIVEKFMSEHKDASVRLYITKEHKGKTNAQNEAQKTVKSDILVMTDANSLFEENTVLELVKYLYDENVAYVTGRLCYTNVESSVTSSAEGTYWESDLKQRQIESDLQSVTAGNGAVYACKNKLYYDFEDIMCHDSAMPKYFAEKGLRSVYNPNAIAYEKAGENTKDEFNRKVRMNRMILKNMFSDLKYLNPFKFGWFSYCYFGHRICRYYLWLAHILLLLSSSVLVFVSKGVLFYVMLVVFCAQFLFYFIAILESVFHSKSKMLYLIYYYTMTICAQMLGVWNGLLGRTKAIWEKAESTR